MRTVVREYYDDEDSRVPRWLGVAVMCLVGACIVGAAWWIVFRDDDGSAGDVVFPPASEVAGAVSEASVAPMRGSSPTTPMAGTGAPGTSTSAVPSTAVSAPSVTATSATSTSVTSLPIATASSVAVETSVSPSAAAGGSSYPTSADGTPLPILVTFDLDTITLTGLVPSQAAKDRLAALALANSKTEARLVNNLLINPDVPIGVGVRIMELNSARFPEGSAELLPAHASEFVRVAEFMKALPNVTAVVIGHADQRGDEVGNYEISAERAQTVVDFLTYLGVSPTRLSSRAVGEADLLTLADDDTALALNRRTEFILYGLLVD